MERNRRFALRDLAGDIDNVLRLRRGVRESAGAPARERGGQGRGWAVALDAIEQASQQMSATESWARDIEARGVALAERALKELREAGARVQAAEDMARNAEARLRDAEERLRQAEARAQEAETRAQEAEDRAQESEDRAQEAEEWRARLQEAIQDRLLTRRPETTRSAIRAA